jgi:hypothetical protein
LLAVFVTCASVFVCTVGSSAHAVPAQAAPSTTLTWSVRPTPTDAQPARPNFSYEVEGGDTITDSVRVRNFGTAPLSLAIYASDALTSRTGALDLLPASKKPRDVGAWIELDTSSISLEPGQSIDVPFTMAVPRNAASGDHTGGIVTSVTTPGTDANDSPVLLDRRLGTRVQVRVGGPLRPRLRITELQAEYDGTLNPVGKGTLHVTYTVRNTGNVRVTAIPTIRVKGPLGLVETTLRTAAMPELLPANSLTFTVDVAVWPAVHLDATVELQPRTTEDRQELPAAATSATASVGVWAIPWALLAIIVVVIAGVVLWVWLRRRRARQVDDKVQQAVADALGSRDAGAST